MLESVKAGADINIAGLEPPNYDPSHSSAIPEKAPAEIQQSAENVAVSPDQKKTSQVSGDPAAPVDTMDALNMRIQKFSQIIEDAKNAGNSGKVRRHDRLLKVRLCMSCC